MLNLAVTYDSQADSVQALQRMQEDGIGLEQIIEDMLDNVSSQCGSLSIITTINDIKHIARKPHIEICNESQVGHLWARKKGCRLCSLLLAPH
jgi:hypothetical protein